MPTRSIASKAGATLIDNVNVCSIVFNIYFFRIYQIILLFLKIFVMLFHIIFVLIKNWLSNTSVNFKLIIFLKLIKGDIFKQLIHGLRMEKQILPKLLN